MFEKLENTKNKFYELEKDLANPDLIANMDEWQKVNREYVDLRPLVKAYEEYRKNEDTIKENKEMLEMAEDQEMKDLLHEEIGEAEDKLESLEEKITFLLIPKDPNDYKNVFVEIRSGAGGDEAALFAGDLYRMYQMFANNNGYKTEEIEYSEQGTGGVKEVIFMVKGEGAYSKLKYESGVHRVQRVPQTETQGRIHTSTATVAVLPEAGKIDIEIDESTELRIDYYRSSGAGGQHVNTTDSAVRITHLPTGIVVACQDERSQIKNKAKAMNIMYAKLYDFKLEQQQKELSEDRKTQVGTGDRSEKIRTYNFPQGRVTDHRINKTIYQLDNFLNGDIQEMIDALILEDQTKKLELSQNK
ncbi:peptide chain release factor 1 [Helcococcus kunzii]|uniref:Peptide chain release factor 1 n=1 Tax=Helcococcus kunzii ATCC 51366 TaxID=883114 RepID=H3NLU4_9FIRM|nr:peptide chain release factor 1 [Helcococcus kunzii]EHR35614.1 peptide chain release factor 1 [Helcococcus kunzii ATCC 51366]MCT1796243.1 peptide chain release factor 1 [Helcococcus kunzii]MCT1988902.1 peptide chain release factor 1 [Helcococcus kunzii]QUY64227.1 peptide chain release factor 1 [Helcococcus kunzii]QZO76683.1 peptide chain release factor 1 [Helcococcus kunzii]